ncbi:hypothetical protein TNCT_470121 [Trichonephila clavata]|uniref:Uncharacterized protein n=1 Tax=Trichonephila clavata TaxID=2740835 RepID=A0A8X6F1U0_TRICU|nr:hypothetical protein TNCT_470121 [Trichonephila clavata]
MKSHKTQGQVSLLPRTSSHDITLILNDFYYKESSALCLTDSVANFTEFHVYVRHTFLGLDLANDSHPLGSQRTTLSPCESRTPRLSSRRWRRERTQ